jgi:hypothetical protein
MRAQGDPDNVQWLLDLEIGILPSIPPNSTNLIEIDRRMILPLSYPTAKRKATYLNNPHELAMLIEVVFGNNINTLSSAELSGRAILSATRFIRLIRSLLVCQMGSQGII